MTDAATLLLVDQNLPFAVALGVLALLAAAQAVGAGDLLGDADADIDMDVDGDADMGLADGLASVVGLGRLPVLLWLTVLLAVFALIGLSGQQLIRSLTGAMLPALPASGLALIAALPLTGLAARPLAAILPHDETTAVPIESLLGRRGRIAIGRATAGSPARASVPDVHGHLHHVMVEPHEAGAILREGDEVLLVGREGELFRAVALGDPLSIEH